MREAALRAIESRIARVAAEADPSAVLEPGALDDAHQLAASTDDSDLRAQLALGWFHTYRHQALPDSTEDREAAVRAFTPCFVADFGELPGSLLRYVMPSVVSTAGTMLMEVGTTRADPAELLQLSERIRANVDSSSPLWSCAQTCLAAGLLIRYTLYHRSDDLESAISAYEVAIGAAAPEYPIRGAAIAGLGEAVAYRYEHSAGLAEHVRAAIDGGIGVPGVHSELAGDPLFQQGFAASGSKLLVERFDRTADRTDLDTAINCLWRVWTDTSLDSSFAAYLQSALLLRYTHTGDPADLDSTVRICEHELANGGNDRADAVLHLANLGLTWFRRFERFAARSDIDTAMTF